MRDGAVAATMQRGNPSFAVVCMAKETPELLTQFARYYVSIGAEEVYLFIDGIETPALAVLATEPRVRLSYVDDTLWEERLGAHARHIGRRQSYIYTCAQHEMSADWLLIVDADEFLIARTPIHDMLANIPDNVDAFMVPPAEAVWGPGDDIGTPFGATWFRRPLYYPVLSDMLAWALYGRDAGFFRRCMLSHTQGKHFVRRTARFTRIGVHSSRRDGRNVTVGFSRRPKLGVSRSRSSLHSDNEIAHFDAGSFERWQEKFRRRYTGEIDSTTMKQRHTLAQIRTLERILGSGKPWAREDAADLFRRLYSISRTQVRMMRALGLAFRAKIFHSPTCVTARER